VDQIKSNEIKFKLSKWSVYEINIRYRV